MMGNGNRFAIMMMKVIIAIVQCAGYGMVWLGGAEESICFNYFQDGFFFSIAFKKGFNSDF